ncbi:hypothetical protein PCYB_042040 [Plasmodium cynomolgi strain B]|uniref:Uncharacterized protein n=1 Tax=Plasmodium cynomolgi (strain B) TaxID=1120755 RepID=K6V7E1_PLACD|nr:hypothetical protein PCYB_042040 [Plasmodium cynomolgi strain B]GAB65002.1 hypothetical protein PCYB_042040 [Plasmodium cynomolgi strain B]
MNLSITIRGGLAGSSSEASQSGSKKYGSNVLHKTKLKKDVPEKRKGKIVAKKSKNLSPKLTGSISTLPSDRRNNLHALEGVLSEVGDGDRHQGWRKYAHKFGLLGRLVSKGHTGSASSGGTQNGGSIRGTTHSGSNSQRSAKKSTHPNDAGSKLVKQDAKANTQEEKKKSYLTSLQKNIPPKKNKNSYSSNLNTPTVATGGKKSYKLSSGGNGQEGGSTDGAKQSVTASSSLAQGVEVDNEQVVHLTGKILEDQDDPSRETPLERYTAEPIDPYFTKGEYDASKDILREKTCFYDAGKVSTSLLPGYKEVSFEEIGVTKGNNASAMESRRAQRNAMYLPNRFYSPHNFEAVRSMGGQNEAYYINGLRTLDGCLFTSVDLSQATIHKQYNIGVTYPYGVPFVDVKQRGRQGRR